MKSALVFITGLLFNCVQCHDSESFENNGVEVGPLYETIIYSDIADILNEFERNNDAYDKANNESESNEEIDDLLSEYHHYLERAHKQRVNYLEKNKPKNKVPIIRREKFTKIKSPAASKYNEYFKNSFFKPEHKSPQVLSPFNMFIPFNSNKFMSTSEQPFYNNDLNEMKKIIFNGESPMSPFSSLLKPPCCKDGRASCKQCPISLDRGQQRQNEENVYNINDPLSPERSDDTINVRIKVDVQLPKFQPDRVQFYNPQSRDKMSDYDVGASKEYLSAIKLPSPYLNFPIPLNLFGYKKITNYNNKHDTQNPLHKITIHKKKKPKVGNTSKKHRKKVVSVHNVKIEPELSYAMFNESVYAKNNTDNNITVIMDMPSNKTLNVDSNLAASTTPLVNLNTSETQTEENVLFLVNITNSIDNVTNEKHKIENSIETDYTNAVANGTTEKSFHLIRKREIMSKNKTSKLKVKSDTHQTKSTIIKNSTLKSKLKKKYSKKSTGKLMAHKTAKSNSTLAKLEKAKNNIKKLNNSLPTDLELLYWPNSANKSTNMVKNITAIIIEYENKKSKMNMSTETIRHNHTRALEQAIFGDVDWNDIDTVAPAFVSFVGKYMEGILTFCNERICHSMKCTKQNCLHRVCAPKERFNKGHCTGSNDTDSVASMASVMDLPSNIAFEIVDILQDRMVGKLFGKITLCISAKCITFAASKKVSYEFKCINTELDPKGHCIRAKVA